MGFYSLKNHLPTKSVPFPQTLFGEALITIHQVKGLEDLLKQLLDENAALKTQIADLQQFINSELKTIDNTFQSMEDASTLIPVIENKIVNHA